MYEFIFAFLIIMILYSVAYKYLADMTETVERTDFTRTLNRMQAQLTLNVASWYSTGKRVSKQQTVSQNPTSFLKSVPENYQGELHSDKQSECRVSRWCYLTDKHWMIYRAKYTEELETSNTDKDILVYELVISFTDQNTEVGLATAMTLKPVYEFTWQDVGFN
ncbi:MAG: hypothetical protein ACRBB6_09960 [Neptuniibacter sp.]